MNKSWITEKHTEGYAVKWNINKVLHTEKTPFQELSVVETIEWGRALLLDGALQVSEKDEFIYHEMITHVGMYTHPNPEKVLIIGGGDGGTLREVVKHKSVKMVDMVEIDGRVIETSKKYFPSISSAFGHELLNLYLDDGVEFVKNTSCDYDVVILDSSDPVGPAEPLFNREFYQDVFNILKEDGLVVVQSESPIFYTDVFKTVFRNINSVFPQAYVFLAAIPTYVSGPWSFTVGTKKHDPRHLSSDTYAIDGLKYYNEGIHRAAFCLPQFIRNMINV